MARLLPLFFVASFAAAQEPPIFVREGSSPQIAMDRGGVVRMVMGRSDSIFVVTSTADARSFSAPTLVGVIPGMHLGNTRGPVIASSTNRSAILAVDTKGTITVFELDHRTNRWARLPAPLNTVEGSAPEGLATIAADGADNFYATWLDLREARQNQIYFARVGNKGDRSAANRILYASPDGHVCECCRPTVVASGRHVAVMFRNWLDGARDLYLTRSSDGGATFTPATRLGVGTWKLDACPMDGGSMILRSNGDVATVWRRELDIYVAGPGQPEERFATGRSPMMAAKGKTAVVVWQDGRDIKLRSLDSDVVTVVGQGRLPQVLTLRDGKTLVAWERDGRVYFRKL
jgi:hypothetical protein